MAVETRPAWWTLDECCAELGIARSTMLRYVALGRNQFGQRRIGKRLINGRCIDAAALFRWLEKR